MAGAEEGDLGESLDTAAIQRWEPVAESLVRDGVTSKDPLLVATILAHREAGVPPNTIGRTHKVHHSTVGRIALNDHFGAVLPTPRRSPPRRCGSG